MEVGAIDEAALDLRGAVEGADLIILCTPVGLFPDILKQISPHLLQQAIVTDVGSTKRSVVKIAEAALPKGVYFVGSHPMAGSEKRGVEFAKPDLFQGARCIITPTPRTDPRALATVEEFWRMLGMRTLRLSPDDHDRLVCDISHLPHALAAALVSMQSDDALALAGKGFLDSTRIAGGDGGLWRDIFQDNRDNVADSILRLRNRLDDLLKLLDPKHHEELRAWLDAAAERRAKLLAEKLRELNPE